MAIAEDVNVASGRLIAGGKVAGTSVYNLAGEKLGSIEDVMIDKPSGRIAYAILNFGGFLGIGGRHHPLPWSILRYDTEIGGYVVNIDPRVFEGAPAYAEDETVEWEDPAWGQRLHDHYGAATFWTAMP